MKVLVVTSQPIEERNGSFFCNEILYDSLNHFAELGELHVCAQRYRPQRQKNLNCDLNGLVQDGNIHYMNTLEAAILEVDLVVGCLPSLIASKACSIAKRLRKKYLAYVTGCPREALWKRGFRGKIFAIVSSLRLRHTLRKSDYALYVTEQFLQKRYPCPGITGSCSNLRIGTPNEDNLKKRLAKLDRLSDDSTLRIATIANYSEESAGIYSTFFSLFFLKRAGISKFHYHLIGTGDNSHLKKFAQQLEISELVHFEEIVSHNQISAKLDEMHIYLQPSVQETFPQILLEAMSRGLSCICTNTATIQEMIEPEYIVEEKTPDDIKNALRNVSIEDLQWQAERNFNYSKNYTQKALGKKRKAFFDLVKCDFQLT